MPVLMVVPVVMVVPAVVSVVLVAVVIPIIIMTIGDEVPIPVVTIKTTIITPEGREDKLRLRRRNDSGRGSKRDHGCEYELPHGYLHRLMFKNGNAGLFVPSRRNAKIIRNPTSSGFFAEEGVAAILPDDPQALSGSSV
ncbi:hypothetical protein BPNPMPFG_005828 [Mesorhizobium sp. AR07]|uniref:hypothetical protein n=1 Tax=Mesorhizobium sp. AR07 TaxID=2865838 RepID=UPI00215E21A0|nr:hypothetical protein [Mesorhizobium sp. AR07]UVK43969.1 hypothetical protein BPNPMPFG_005828 [Mesorhizobium sp. AR07]